MTQRNALDTDWYSVKVKLEASYVVTVPANSEEEALREAHRANLPVRMLFDVDKTASFCNLSANEIVLVNTNVSPSTIEFTHEKGEP